MIGNEKRRKMKGWDAKNLNDTSNIQVLYAIMAEQHLIHSNNQL